MQDFRNLLVWGKQYHLLLARGLQFLSADEHHQLASEVGEVKKMLSSLIRTVKPLPPKPLVV